MRSGDTIVTELPAGSSSSTDAELWLDENLGRSSFRSSTVIVTVAVALSGPSLPASDDGPLTSLAWQINK